VLQRLQDDPFLERDMPAEQYVYPAVATMACVPAQADLAIAGAIAVGSPVPVAPGPSNEEQQRAALHGDWQFPHEPDEDAVLQLLQMGFEPELVALALQQAGNDLSLALEMLVAPQFPSPANLAQLLPAPAQPLPPAAPVLSMPHQSLQLAAASPMNHAEPPRALASQLSVPASPSVLIDAPVAAPPSPGKLCGLCNQGVALPRYRFCATCEAAMHNISL
jgi:hypothetical protein